MSRLSVRNRRDAHDAGNITTSVFLAELAGIVDELEAHPSASDSFQSWAHEMAAALREAVTTTTQLEHAVEYAIHSLEKAVKDIQQIGGRACR